MDSKKARLGDPLKVLDVLATDVGLIGVFSDWAAPVTKETALFEAGHAGGVAGGVAPRLLPSFPRSAPPDGESLEHVVPPPLRTTRAPAGILTSGTEALAPCAPAGPRELVVRTKRRKAVESQGRGSSA